MGFLDADGHVNECPDTWSYLPKSMVDIRPLEITFNEQPGYVTRPVRGLFIDGLLSQQFLDDDEVTNTTADSRELRDVPRRLKDLDALGIDVQVIYPTILLREVTIRPEVELALCQSYNRWIADRCQGSGGRLQWTAVLPIRSMPAALDEMRRVKAAGAVGVYKRCYEFEGRRAGDPYFDPLYDLAQELDLPICCHAGYPFAGYHASLTKTHRDLPSTAYVPDALLSICSGTASRFPRLRFGFIEGASSWLPWILWMLDRQGDTSRERFAGLMEEHRVFVTCEPSENLPEIIGQVGDDHLLVGTDYVHSSRGMLTAHREIMARVDIDAASAQRITVENGRRFYGLG